MYLPKNFSMTVLLTVPLEEVKEITSCLPEQPVETKGTIVSFRRAAEKR